MTPKKIFYSMCAGLVLTITGVGYSLYLANTQLKQRALDISQLNAEVDTLDTQIDNARTLKSELEDLQEVSRLTSEVLPAEKSQENIVGELVQIATNRNITLNSINFTGGAGGPAGGVTQSEKVDGIPGVFSLKVQTSFESSYSTILELLRDLENNKRRFEVTDISISPNQTETAGTPLFNASLDIVTYIKP